MNQDSKNNEPNGQDEEANASAESLKNSEASSSDNVVNLEDALANDALKSNGTSATSQAVDPVAEWKTKSAYLAAEIDNMRKRFAREKQDILKFSNEDMITKFLPVLDCLELALKSVKDAEGKLEDSIKDNPKVQSLVKGIDMTLKVFEQTLESVGCTALKGQGETFDPSRHEALGQSHHATLGDNVVSQVLQRGFALSGRVIRTAKVMVNKIVN